jgi:hypothetical protein
VCLELLLYSTLGPPYITAQACLEIHTSSVRVQACLEIHTSSVLRTGCTTSTGATISSPKSHSDNEHFPPSDNATKRAT